MPHLHTPSISLFTLLVTLLSFLPFASAFSAFGIHIRAGGRECFYEKLKQNERLDLSFEVSQGGQMDIDFWISSPNGNTLYSVQKQSTTSFGFNADQEGTYTYCFGNGMSTVTDKTLSFTVQGPDEWAKLDEKMLLEDDDSHEGLAQEIQTLANGLEAMNDEQAYMKRREEAHRKTAESTNRRILWWSLFEALLLVGICRFQVSYLKRFFEVKRLV
ncbi:p24 complex component [Borealophlyctis nickersoniae]|nr:p24 complex component [Borealophlyctis nickersoniae]